MTTFADIINTAELLNYRSKSKQTVQKRMLGSLFPDKKIPNNKLITAVDSNIKPYIAKVHSSSATAEKVSYDDQVFTGELFDFRQSHEFDPDEITALLIAQNQDRDFLLKDKLRYGVLLSQAIEDAMELARYQVLTKGKFSQTDAQGNAYTFDYKLGKDQKLAAVDFADASFDPIGDYFLPTVTNANFAVTRGLMSQVGWFKLAANPNVVKRVYGENATVKSVMPQDLRNYFESQGLPNIVASNDSYATIDKSGNVKKNVKYMDENAIALFGDEDMGETVYGVSPEEAIAKINGGLDIKQVGNVMLSSYSESNPVSDTILASSKATITLGSRFQLLQGTVLK